MIDIYVLDGNLEQIGIVDNYTSLIWVNRYQTEGDCEIYIRATTENIKLFKKGYYLARNDDEMVCRIEKIELDTDTENGNYMTVTGYDVKKILGQRIIWSQSNVDGNVENYIRQLVYESLVNPNLSARQIKNANGRPNFFLGNKANFPEVTTEQATYKPIDEKVQEFCQRYDWGYKVIVDVGNFYFLLYKGTDRSNTVIFSNDFENLISSKYVEDSSNLANVCLVAGEGEGSDRSRNVAGYAEGLERNEIYVDARDLSRTISWSELIGMYPTTDQGGHGHIDVTSTQQAIVYRMDIIDIPIVDDNQLTELKANYPNGQEIKKDGVTYYQIYDVVIADLPSQTMTANDNVILRDLVYSVFLLNRAYENLAEYGTTVSFEGSIEPNITFKYKRDYFLGDQVTVRNEYGIEATARIVEVTEVYDDNGYSVEPLFEYHNNGDTGLLPSNYLMTENGIPLQTESGEYLLAEGSD